MDQFAYGFSLTLLHSLWQSALLLLIYSSTSVFFKTSAPSVRRNLLFVLLSGQLIASIITFTIYFSGSQELFENALTGKVAAFITEQPQLKMLSPWVIAIYLLVVFYKCFSLFYHWNRFKVKCGNTWIRPSAELRLFTQSKANNFGIHRKVSVWLSSVVSSPVTYGFFKPIILMPVALVNQLTTEETETLIIHELTHIKNNDFILNFLLITMDTLFFFNPFIRIIGNQIRLEREKNCDVQVMHFKYSPLLYAETLLKTARFRPVNHIFQLAAVSRQKQLLNRILYFTSDKNLVFKKRSTPGLNLIIFLFIIGINIFALTSVFNKKNTPSPLAYNITGIQSDKALAFNSPVFRSDKVNKARNAMVIINEEENVINKEASAITSKINTETANDIETELLYNEVQPENEYFLQVSDQEENSKEIIIKEEEAGSGSSITKAYKITYRNGEWIAEPLWVLTEAKLMRDSIQIMKDTISRSFNILQ